MKYAVTELSERSINKRNTLKEVPGEFRIRTLLSAEITVQYASVYFISTEIQMLIIFVLVNFVTTAQPINPLVPDLLLNLSLFNVFRIGIEKSLVFI